MWLPCKLLETYEILKLVAKLTHIHNNVSHVVEEPTLTNELFFLSMRQIITPRS